MKTMKTLAMMMLMSTAAATTFTSCSDDLTAEDMKSNAEVPVLINNSNLEALDNYSYEIPYEVKAKGEWRIDFEWEEGKQICYASPKQGKGDTKINICVLDNATDQHLTGEMVITDFGDNGKKTVVKLGQKSRLEGTRAGEISTGNCIYGVGYGYNAISGELAANQIVKVADAIKDKQLSTEGVRASYQVREYKGSCFSQLCNDFKADATFSGKYFGFKAEAGASFDSKYLRESNRDFVISMVDVTTTQASLGYNRDQIIEGMTDGAYNAINGLAMKSLKGRPMKTSYPSTNDGFRKLIQDFGTHMLVRAELGGKMKYATTIDLSKVESEYTLNAYAKCSYKNKLVKANASVSNDLAQQFNSNSEAISTRLTIRGGSPTCLESLSKEDNDYNMDAWLKSLQDNQNTVVVNLPKAQMIPLWELVNTAEPGGEQRQQMLKEYMKDGGQMERDFAKDDKGITQEMGQIAHISNLAAMAYAGSQGSLIRDLYIGGTMVARVCSEFIPKFSTTERSVVVYPVYNNRVRYNMGYFIGNSAWAPQYISWKNEGDPVVNKAGNFKPGMQNELYLSGSSFYAANDTIITKAEEPKVDVKVQEAFMKGRATRADGTEFPHDYPIVKIFNRIWTSTPYNQLTNKNTINYSPSDTKSFTIDNWHMAYTEDFENLKNGLTSNNISLPALYMADVEGGNNLTGFHIDWEGWYVRKQKQAGQLPVFGTVGLLTNLFLEKNAPYYWEAVNQGKDQMEYMTCDKDGKNFGHVRLKKSGSMEIVKNEFDHSNWRMQVRMVQPLNPEKK